MYLYLNEAKQFLAVNVMFDINKELDKSILGIIRK